VTDGHDGFSGDGFVTTRRGKWSKSAVAAQLALLTLVTYGCGEEEAPRPVPLDERTPKVLLIGIDGVRADVLMEVPTPHFDALANGGTLTLRTRTTTPSMSGPAWSSMLTGVWPGKHGVVDNEFVGRRYDAWPGFLDRIEAVRPELSTFAVVDWTPLMDLEGGSTAIGPAVDRRELLDGYELGWAEADARATALAVQHLSSADPDALFVYLGNADETSHETGAIGPEYREAIALADEHIGLLIGAMRARPTFPQENWLVIVSTDHGRRADGGHGGDSVEEMTTFLLVSGPGASAEPAVRDTYIVDVAATALTHLGLDIDPAWDLDGVPFALR
jgi:arylsulfatase A-like enzyme